MKIMRNPFRMVILVGILAVLLHKGWFYPFPYSGKEIPEAERISIILTDYFNKVSPRCYYTIHFEFYNRYMGFVSKNIYKIIKNYIDDPKIVTWLVGRLLSAVFLIAILMLTVAIGNKLFCSPLGEIGALLCLISPGFVYYCQTGLHHFHFIFWFILAYYFIIRTFYRRRPSSYLLAGFFTGLSIAVVYTGVILFLLGIVLFFTKKFEFDRKKVIPTFVVSVLIGYLIGSPSSIFHPDWLLKNIYYFLFYRNSLETYRNPSLIESLAITLLNIFPHTFGWVLWLFSLIGIIFILVDNEHKKVENGIFLITLCLSLLPVISAGVTAYPARVIFLTPLLSISSSYVVWGMIQTIKVKMRSNFFAIIVLSILTVLIFGYQIINTLAYLNTKTSKPILHEVMEFIRTKNLHRSIIVLLPTNLREIVYYYHKNSEIKTIYYDPYDFQESGVFFQTEFDFAIVEDLDVVYPYLDWRRYYFRKNVDNFIKLHKMNIIKVFSNIPSFAGIDFKLPFNDPLMSIISERKFFLISGRRIECKVSKYTSELEYVRKNFLKAVINVKSKFSSNGYLSIENLLNKILKYNVDVVILSDSLLRKCEINIFGKDIIYEQNSILKSGINQWVNEIKNAEKKFKNNLIIPGVECTPYYYWTGNIFQFNLTLNNGSKHLIVLGLDNYKDYIELPVGLNNQNTKKDEISIYNYFIQAVRNKGGVVYWSRPDRMLSFRFINTDFARFRTLPYGDFLIKTKNYTGFSVLNEGLETAEIGSFWDQALLEYCTGKRQHIPYIIGEANYGIKDKTENLNVFTFIKTNIKNKQGVINLLEKGKCYAVRSARCGHLVYLKDFKLEKNYLIFSVISEHNIPFLVEVVYSGKIFRTYLGNEKLEVKEDIKKLIESAIQSKSKQYFRIKVTDEAGGILVSNPIFIENIK